MLTLKADHKPTLVVGKDFYPDGNCTFCTSRTVPQRKLSSNSPDRRLVVFLCEYCVTELVDQLVTANIGLK